MATHSSILDWKIPWAEETGGLQSGVAESDTTERLSNLLIDTLHLDIVCFFHRKGENNYIKFYRPFKGFLKKKKKNIYIYIHMLPVRFRPASYL